MIFALTQQLKGENENENDLYLAPAVEG